MGSVTRKAAVTAGLGAAIVAGTAGSAMAVTGGNAGLLNPNVPTVPKVAQENSGTLGPFPISGVTDSLPTGQVTGGLDTAAQTATQSLPTNALPANALPTSALPGVPGLTG
ncbi:hypothetical protein [Streptodolium elevatio]|uniref:ATP-binding protein n=1 Tax=Streptodolium elevatio TaxID=3157996 RepID=A0ABV3DUB3_9ACTN